MKAILIAALVLFGCSTTTSAFAWGDVGHKIVCEIAFQKVSPATREKIVELIGVDGKSETFSAACTWPDHPRKRAEEHFVNLPRDAAGLVNACGGATACAVTAIGADFAVLASKSSSQAAKAESLKFLGHWVGDVHQPLHVSFKDDRGGNEIQVSGECDKDLHATWDTCMVVAALGRDIRAAAFELMTSTTPAQIKEWTKSTAKDWANESFQITESEKTKYCVRHGSSCDKPQGTVKVDANYLKDNEPVIREQLQKGGIRLAHLLDMALRD